ncbi:MAG: hypothetical protein IPL39_20230 [Opitutaceae bacterium]|nr:hypothetical protein [Opitutaceae bacterium]
MISDDDLTGLLADRITFARVLCMSRRWIDFVGGGHFEIGITKDGFDLLARLTGTKVDFANEQREAMAHQLLQVVLAGIPMDQLVAAMRIDPSIPPPKWIEDREKYTQDYFGAAVIQAKRDALVGHSNKAAVWDLLEQHRREAKVCWPYKEYLCRLMFAVDFERTDKLAKELLLSVTVPKDEHDLFEREEMLTAILKDQFPTYRQMIKDLYFVTWPQKLNGASDLTGTINRYIIREGEEKQRLWEEIQRDPRYASVASRR